MLKQIQHCQKNYANSSSFGQSTLEKTVAGYKTTRRTSNLFVNITDCKASLSWERNRSFKKKNAWLENSTTNANLFVNVTDSKASLFRERNRSFKTTLLGGSRVTMYAHLFRRHDQVIDRMMKRLPNHNHIVFLSDGSILLFWKLYNPMYRIRFQIRFWVQNLMKAGEKKCYGVWEFARVLWKFVQVHQRRKSTMNSLYKNL